MEDKEVVLTKLTEKQFAKEVEDLLNLFGWYWIHIRPARVLRHGKEIYETPYSGKKGFLDYLALRQTRQIVFELKREDGEMTPEQQEWFTMWKQIEQAEVYLWKPSQFLGIVEILR